MGCNIEEENEVQRGNIEGKKRNEKIEWERTEERRGKVKKEKDETYKGRREERRRRSDGDEKGERGGRRCRTVVVTQERKSHRVNYQHADKAEAFGAPVCRGAIRPARHGAAPTTSCPLPLLPHPPTDPGLATTFIHNLPVTLVRPLFRSLTTHTFLRPLLSCDCSESPPTFLILFHDPPPSYDSHTILRPTYDSPPPPSSYKTSKTPPPLLSPTTLLRSPSSNDAPTTPTLRPSYDYPLRRPAPPRPGPHALHTGIPPPHNTGVTRAR